MNKFQKFLIFIILVFLFISFIAKNTGFANDFPFTSRETLILNFSLPQTWSNLTGSLGEYTVSTLWAWPLQILYSAGSHLGFNFLFLLRIFGVIPIILISIYSVSVLLRRFKISGWAKTLGILFYLLNTYILLIIDGGQFQIGLAYSIFPLAFLKVVEAVEGRKKQKILAGIFVSFLGFFDTRFIYVLFLLLFIYFIYESIFIEKKYFFFWFFSWLKTGVFIFVIFLGLNFYWIFPAVLIKAPSFPETYQRTTQISFLSFAKLGHALFLLQPHWYKNVFGKVTPLLPEFAILPILVFLSPVLKKKDKIVGFWILVALIGAFLVKGSNPPLAAIYPFLFAKIPGFSLFRDPTKFFFLVCISYTVLIAKTSEELVERFGFKVAIGKKFKLAVLPLLLIVYFLILMCPIWQNKMTGTFSEPVYQDEYKILNQILEKDSKFSRVFWIPSRSPLGYSSYTHPSLEALRVFNKRPFASGVVGSYEVFNFLREAAFLGEIFDISSVSFIVYPFPDTRREELKQDNVDYYHLFSNQIESLPWIKEKLIDFPVNVYKTKSSSEHFFLTANTFLVVGSDRILEELMKFDNFKLRNNAIIFAEEKPEISKNLANKDGVKIILYKKDILDLEATLIPRENFIFPSQNLDFEPNSKNFWKRESADFVWWRNFLQQKYSLDTRDFDYGAGLAISEKEGELTLESENFSKGKVLLARVMQSPRGGSIEFYQGHQRLAEINTKTQNSEKIQIRLTTGDFEDKIFEYEDTSLKWFEVGELSSSHPLTIKTKGDINVLNSLIVISRDELESYKNLVNNFEIMSWDALFEKEIENLFLNKEEAIVSYSRISPTHYKVEIQGLKKPATLAFSDSYDNFWMLNNKGSYPLYSLINGFYLEKDGVYDVYYMPQKYILPGVLFSFLFLMFIFIAYKKSV